MLAAAPLLAAMNTRLALQTTDRELLALLNRRATLAQALERHPERVIETAVKGMLPKNTLGRAMYRKLKVYSGAEHPHAAQQPQVLDI